MENFDLRELDAKIARHLKNSAKVYSSFIRAKLDRDAHETELKRLCEERELLSQGQLQLLIPRAG